MVEEKLTIGKMARLTGTTIQTLRYYDRLGLFSPDYTDKETGYRYYNIEQIAQLDIIKYLKISGLSLLEIRDFFNADNVDEKSLMQLFDQKIKGIEIAIEELSFQKMAISKVIDSFARSENIPEMGTIALVQCEKKYAMVYEGDCNYYQNTLLYEKGLLKLKEKMRRYSIPYFYSFNPGAITRKRCLTKGKLFCNELFVYTDKLYCDYKVPIVEIPGGLCICIYCNDVMREEAYVYRLLDYIRQHDMRIAGDCIQESINDLAAIRQDRKHLTMLIRIPIYFPKN